MSFLRDFPHMPKDDFSNIPEKEFKIIFETKLKEIKTFNRDYYMYAVSVWNTIPDEHKLMIVMGENKYRFLVSLYYEAKCKAENREVDVKWTKE